MAFIYKLRDKSRRLAAAITAYAKNVHISHHTPKSLPPELWLLVFELVLESYCSPLTRCDYRTFLRIRGRLHLPSMYLPIDEQCRKLRLVCHAFRELLQRYPLVFVMKDDEKPLTSSSKAVYISRYQNAAFCLERLLAEPTKSRHITALDVPLEFRYQVKWMDLKFRTRPMLFDLLCANASALRGMTNLTLDTRCLPSRSAPAFWRRLSDAFPELTCLVLRGHSLDSTEDGANITFARLEILDLDGISPPVTLHFPVLRYFACQELSANIMAILPTSPLVESILFRWSAWSLRGIPGHSFSPESLLLGLPVTLLDKFANQVPNNPVLHLCIYMETLRKDYRPKAEDVIRRAVHRLSTVSYFTFDFTKVANWQEYRIDKCLASTRIEALGLIEVPFLRGGMCRTFERIHTGSQAGSHFGRSQQKWKALHQSTSRILRI